MRGAKARRLVFREEDGGAMATLRRRGKEWEHDPVDTWDATGTKYAR